MLGHVAGIVFNLTESRICQNFGQKTNILQSNSVFVFRESSSKYNND